MTIPDPSRLTVRSPADLLAVVPYLLGFHPLDSVVVVALTGPRITFVARGDLPTPDPAGPSSAAAAGAVVDCLTEVLLRQTATATVLIGYGPAHRVTPLVDAARHRFPAVGLPIRDALRVTDGRYYSYLCTDPACCPPEGVAFDPTSNPLAAQATVAGHVALPDRAALAASVAPVAGPARRSMHQATVRALTRLTALTAAVADPAHVGRSAADSRAGHSAAAVANVQALIRSADAALSAAVRQHRDGGRLSDDDAAWLVVLLQHPAVRDLAWQHTDRRAEDLPLWTDLTRRADPDLAAAPAALLALAAWRSGDGTLAGIALQRALHADPDLPLANLLARLLSAGVPPSALDAQRRRHAHPSTRSREGDTP